jgi:mono/diheme cytochrome c family protein
MSRVQIEITLGLFMVLITSAILLVYGFNEENRMEALAMSHDAKGIEVGAALFESNCSGCHGLKGEGVPGLCPPLNDRHLFTDRLKEVGWSGSLEDYVVATISSGRIASTRPDQYVGGGRPAMPAWSDKYGGPLREDQVRYIAQYVMNWEATALQQVELVEIVSPVSDDPVVRGELVYKNNGCGGCHALGSLSTGAVGPNLTQIGSVAETREDGVSAEEYIRQSIINPNAYVVEGYQPDIMPKNFGEVLTPENLDDLIAFLAAQQ